MRVAFPHNFLPLVCAAVKSTERKPRSGKEEATLTIPSRKSFLVLNQGGESSFNALKISSPPTYFFLSPPFTITTAGVAFTLSVFIDSL